MPVQVELWRIQNQTPVPVTFSEIDSESRLEALINADVGILGRELLVIGRQVKTAFGKFIDLLAVDRDGRLVIIELKKGKTPREVVAQAIDYASWVTDLTASDVRDLYAAWSGKELDVQFGDTFDVDVPESLNSGHEMLIVCAKLDAETERIIQYLNRQHQVPINAVFFRYFKDGQAEYLSRSWVIDPATVQEIVASAKSKSAEDAWNEHDFVVNVDGYDGVSTWEDAVKFGFVSAAGGRWYTRTLDQLKPGHRVFALIPKHGYVGVGEVVEAAVPMSRFQVVENGRTVPIGQAKLNCSGMKESLAESDDNTAYIVRVNWTKTLPNGYWEKGMRANQNTVIRLRHAFTRDKLLAKFGLSD